jgi:hypothetical protein
MIVLFVSIAGHSSGGSPSVSAYKKVVVGMGADEVTALLGKETSTVPTTQASDDTVKVWGDPESDTVVARVSFHGGKVTGKAIASRDLAIRSTVTLLARFLGFNKSTLQPRATAA